MMDTKTLVVGQDVCMSNGPYYGTFGKVAKVTSEGVEVQAEGHLLRFDTDGNETPDSRRHRLASSVRSLVPSAESPKFDLRDPFYKSLWLDAPEFAPWHLDKILTEQEVQDWKQSRERSNPQPHHKAARQRVIDDARS